MNDTIEDDVIRRRDLARLATLRRLYHHVVNGGRLQSRDDDYLGEPANADSLSRHIQILEHKTA